MGYDVASFTVPHRYLLGKFVMRYPTHTTAYITHTYLLGRRMTGARYLV